MDLHWTRESGLVVALTGAGISAESGIPTFRGKNGYWTVGSVVYHPMELATAAAFARMPDDVWQWYLYRRTVCRAAAPNPAHEALVRLERHAGDRFRLLTQNVDGLHLRAGSSRERTYQIHGNIDFMRCAGDCAPGAVPIPDDVGELGAGETLDDRQRALLVCPRCGGPARPHVLWFDEYYDEPHYCWDSSLAAAAAASLLIIVGSTAQTNLPNHVAQLAAARGATIVNVNIEENPFAALARKSGGQALCGPAGELLPRIVDQITGD